MSTTWTILLLTMVGTMGGPFRMPVIEVRGDRLTVDELIARAARIEEEARLCRPRGGSHLTSGSWRSTATRLILGTDGRRSTRFLRGQADMRPSPAAMDPGTTRALLADLTLDGGRMPPWLSLVVVGRLGRTTPLAGASAGTRDLRGGVAVRPTSRVADVSLYAGSSSWETPIFPARTTSVWGAASPCVDMTGGRSRAAAATMSAASASSIGISSGGSHGVPAGGWDSRLSLRGTMGASWAIPTRRPVGRVGPSPRSESDSRAPSGYMGFRAFSSACTGGSGSGTASGGSG